MSGAKIRLRDQLRYFVPWWLSDRHYSSGKSVGYRFLWAMVAVLDLFMEYAVQGLQAAWPGKGTPTSLALIGHSRGILRGQGDTDAQYAAKLCGWLGKWANAGSAQQLAIELHEYLANRPMVRVVTRSGHWTTVAADGTVTFANATWNWDSVTNPERSGYWSEMWIIIYPSVFLPSGKWGDGRSWGGRDSGIGHVVPRVDYQAIFGIIAQWKSAHSRVRSVLWTTNASLFNPAVPSSCPDGTWGRWGTTGSGARVASGRDVTSTRYWEPPS